MSSPRAILSALVSGTVLLAACAPAAAPAPTTAPPPAAAAKPTEAPKPAAAVAAPSPTAATAAKPTEAPKPAAALPKVRVATGGLDFSQVNNLKWADDMKAQGVAEIELVAFENAAQATQATVSGATQMLINAVLPVIQLAQQGGPALVVVAVDLQAPDYILVGRKTIENEKALEGKKLGISTPGDISDTLSRASLKRAGVDVDKVQFVRIGGTSARIAALQQGSIDAGMAHAADGLSAVAKSPDLKNLFTVGKVIQNYIQHGLSVKAEYLASNKALIQKLVDGYVESTRWAAKNKAAYVELGKKELKGLPEDPILSQSYDIFMESKMFGVNGGVADDIVDNSVKLEQEAGTLKGDVPAKAKWLDQSFVNDYLKRKGSV